MPDLFNIVIGHGLDECNRVEGPATIQACVARVRQVLDANGHNYDPDNIESNVRQGVRLKDNKGWCYKVVAARPVPNELGLELQDTLDQINGTIVRVECLTRANWHEKEEMVAARKKLRAEAEELEKLVNVVRSRLGLKTVKAV